MAIQAEQGQILSSHAHARLTFTTTADGLDMAIQAEQGQILSSHAIDIYHGPYPSV